MGNNQLEKERTMMDYSTDIEVDYYVEPESSFVQAVGYNDYKGEPGIGTVFVIINDKIYAYVDVPVDAFNKLAFADSVGAAYHEFVEEQGASYGSYPAEDYNIVVRKITNNGFVSDDEVSDEAYPDYYGDTYEEVAPETLETVFSNSNVKSLALVAAIAAYPGSPANDLVNVAKTFETYLLEA